MSNNEQLVKVSHTTPILQILTALYAFSVPSTRQSIGMTEFWQHTDARLGHANIILLQKDVVVISSCIHFCFGPYLLF